ncbi:MAG: FKBP-type peptidyl-prolyl cis-trans isomerase [Nocardioides sp.]|nr:FKBP-type peptidyl-prolyl cis-trans isomerase [Nocardioides sp.]
MSASLRRHCLSALSVLLLLGVGACGEDTPATESGASADRLGAVTISGEVGIIPSVTWKSRMSATTAEKETIVAGEGPAVTEGGSVLVQYWIGNGYAQEKAVSSYDEGKAELFTLNADLNPLFADAIEGATVGSRVAVTSSASEAFGEGGNPSLGIGNSDSVLIVMDLLSSLAAEPSGAPQPAPSWMPAITVTDGDPSGFDFAGVPQPAGMFRKATLLAGEGERVRKGMTVAVRYLGQVYNGEAPFDENYTGSPATFGIGVGQVISGWDKQVVGSTVGSRIVIEVPPKLGYGAEGNSQAGIAGTDTLFFVIDILAAG